MPVPTKQYFEATLKKLDEAIKLSRDFRIHQKKNSLLKHRRNNTSNPIQYENNS